MTKYISYIRVSTRKQEDSRLGIEAQQYAVRKYTSDGDLIAEYQEVDSGRKKRRPELGKAIAHCKKEGAVLVVAKLDRLSRNLAFLAEIMESDLEFRCCDLPDLRSDTAMGKAMLHVIGAFVELEAKQISERIKAALAARAARGLPNGVTGKARAKANKQAADQFARSMAEHMEALERQGYTTLMEKTEALNRRGIPTASGTGKWYISTVHNLVKRIEALS